MTMCVTSFCNIVACHYLHTHVRHLWIFLVGYCIRITEMKSSLSSSRCIRIHVLCIHLHVSPYIVVLIAYNPSRLVLDKYGRRRIDMYLNGSKVITRRPLIVVLLGCSTSVCYWPHKIAWSNQNSVFQKCEPVVYGRLGLWIDDYGTRISCFD